MANLEAIEDVENKFQELKDYNEFQRTVLQAQTATNDRLVLLESSVTDLLAANKLLAASNTSFQSRLSLLEGSSDVLLDIRSRFLSHGGPQPRPGQRFSPVPGRETPGTKARLSICGVQNLMLALEAYGYQMKSGRSSAVMEEAIMEVKRQLSQHGDARVHSECDQIGTQLRREVNRMINDRGK
ncbi:hypothetical protein BDD12DRAFT_897002 [Trichophaea hybrida]|nr:hypothetical protein BDD12DRAFT_897002 [Trichophaea hybrida]